MNFPPFFYHADVQFIWLSCPPWQTDLNLFSLCFLCMLLILCLQNWSMVHAGVNPPCLWPEAQLLNWNALLKLSGGFSIFPVFHFQLLWTQISIFLHENRWVMHYGSHARCTPGANTASCVTMFRFSSPLEELYWVEGLQCWTYCFIVIQLWEAAVTVGGYSWTF